MSERLDRAVVLALGSNLAGPYSSCQALLEAAIARAAVRRLHVWARSAWWRSNAWPNPADPAFVNGVALVDTDLSPGEVMAVLLEIEREFGRVRGAANAPRTLDLDLIAHGRTVIDGADVTLPHPRAHERRFVMGPLAEIAPTWRHPSSGATAAQLAGQAQVGADAAPLSHAALRKGEQNAI